MRPERAAIILAQAGALLLALLLLLRGLSLGDSLQSPGMLPFTEEPELVTSRYSFTPDGKRVIFHQELDPPPPQDRFKPTPEWFSMSLEGGQVSAAEAPDEDIRPFTLREGKLFLYVGDGASLTTGSLPNTTVYLTALAPNRELIAFRADQENGPSGLYVLDKAGELIWLGEETNISAIAWSPDSQRIAYVARRDGTNQLIAIDRGGSDQRQLTKDSAPKRLPAWLADSKTIVYAAEDQREGSNGGMVTFSEHVFQVNIDNPAPALLLSGASPISSLSAVNGSRQIAFTQPAPGQERNEQLFLLDPATREQRRVYPPMEIVQLFCPASIARGRSTQIGLELANTSRIAISPPLILRVDNIPLKVLGDREEHAQRIESVDLAPGETRRVDFPLKPAPGLYTYISVLINLGEIYPMSAQHCIVPNTYLGLPNLSFLSVTLPLLFPGMVLAIPWLRHRKQRWLWILWGAVPVLVVVLIGVEAAMVG